MVQAKARRDAVRSVEEVRIKSWKEEVNLWHCGRETNERTLDAIGNPKASVTLIDGSLNMYIEEVYAHVHKVLPEATYIKRCAYRH
jgi:hypothetical protein